MEKTKMKRIFQVLMMCLLLGFGITAMGVTVEAEDLKSGDYSYHDSYLIDGDNGTVEANCVITKYNGDDKEVVIPSELDGKKVIEIVGKSQDYDSEGAFSGCDITSVKIPESVTCITGNPFVDCKELNNIEVDKANPRYRSEGNCLIERGTEVIIAGCGNSVIPDSVNKIGNYAFYECSKLTNIILPEGGVGDSAFYKCTGLTGTISITGGSIGHNAFLYCSGITGLVVSERVYSINPTSFNHCTGLNSIQVDENNSHYYSEGNCLIQKPTVNNNYDANLIIGCNTSVIPEGVTSISEWAFSGSGMTNVTIPTSLTRIGVWAFMGCRNLNSINVAKDNAVYYSDGNCIIRKENKTLVMGCNVSVIPSDVKAIAAFSFHGNTTMTQISIPSNVLSIADEAFDDCSNLSTINVEANSYAQSWASERGYTVVSKDVENRNTEVSDVTSKSEVPQTVNTTAQTAQGEENKTVVIPQGSVLKVNSAKCKVRVVSNKASDPAVEYLSAMGKKKTRIIVPDSVTIDGISYKVVSISAKAFSGNKKLTQITIGKNVVKIGKKAFAGCKKLKKIEVKSTKLTKKSIYSNALKGTNKKLMIKVPKKKRKEYCNYFKGKGNRTVVVK